MTLSTISLSELIEVLSEEDLNESLLAFSSTSSDIQSFLRRNAVQFEKTGIARTYLVYYSDSEVTYLAGYFSIANKALMISKRNFERLTKTQRKYLLGSGHRTDESNYSASSILLGQLGKNFSVPNGLSENQIVAGNEILGVAYQCLHQIYLMLGGKILWLECEDHPKLRNFYETNGFKLLQGFQSKNGLLLYVKKLSQI